MKKAAVIKAHRSNYPDPLKLSHGEKVLVRQKETEYPGWIWCETSDNKGWIPESYVDGDNGNAVVTRDYDATELNVDEGDLLIVHYELNEWAWCEKDTGDMGWVPLECLESTQVAECFLFGFVAHSAGVDEYKIRFYIIFHAFKLFSSEDFHQSFTVVAVHLAAEGSNK